MPDTVLTAPRRAALIREAQQARQDALQSIEEALALTARTVALTGGRTAATSSAPQPTGSDAATDPCGDRPPSRSAGVP